VQFGVALHYSHLNIATKDATKDATKHDIYNCTANMTIISNSTAKFTTVASTENRRKDCVNLESEMTYYIVFLIPLPLLIITNMLYPEPESTKTIRDMMLNGLNMLDFIGCIQNFPTFWIVIFYLALGVSVILTAFPNGLEERKGDDEDFNRFDTIITTCRMIFNDGLFFILRINTMVQTGRKYFGMNFVIKEVFSCIFRFVLLLCYRFRNN